MCIVIDVVIRLASLVPGEDDVQSTENKSWHTDGEVQTYVGQWVENYVREDDRRDTSRCSE